MQPTQTRQWHRSVVTQARTRVQTFGKLALALAAAATAATAQPEWVAEGPAPINNGQVEGSSINNGEVSGAIHAVAPHPTNPDILFVGAVNGGIWRTDSARANFPSWVNQTPNLPSTSIGALAFDPTDNTNNTLVAGSGRFSSFANVGGRRIGLLRTTDGGATWNPIDGGTAGLNITGVAPRGNIIVVTSNANDPNDCNRGVHRSIDTGASFVNVNNGLPSGAATALGQNPNDPSELYVDINTFGGNCGTGDGVYRSTDTGASWTKVSDAAMDALGTGHFEIAIGQADNVFVSITPGGQLADVFRSDDGGGTWTAMGIPETLEDGDLQGIHPGGQGGLHNSIVADPVDDNVVYVGGDRQPGPLPNSIGGRNFSGRLFRGDASAPAATRWSPITHAGTTSNSSPHADSRAMAFDAAGDIIEVDDGGVYRRTSPRDNTGDWFSLNGTIEVTEIHNVSLDPVAGTIFSGNQDTGSSRQILSGVAGWNTLNQGDGGDTAVGVRTLGPDQFSDSYSSAQNLGGLQRQTFNEAGVFQENEFPTLTFVDGARAGNNWDGEIDGQFITPIEVNAVNPMRLLIGSSSALYESADRGNTLSELGPGIFTISGGIKFGAQDNENIIWVTNFDGLYVATTAGAAPTLVYSVQNDMRGVALDPEDSSHAFALEIDRVERTDDTGASFNDVTGNLGTFDYGELRGIVYMSNGAGDAIAVSATRGVYLARASDNFSTWSQVGSRLPNAPAYEVDYDPAGDKLVVGTLGRGAFSISGLLTGGNQPPAAVNDVASVARGGTVMQLDSGQNSVLANDTDPDGDNLTVSTNPVTPPAGGTVTLNANGTFQYTHSGLAATTDSFVYQVCDDGNPSQCDNAQVVVNITGDGANLNCRSPGTVIPEDGTITDTLAVADGGTLTDLNVTLDITHSFVGDLIISLRHDTTGTSITLLDNPSGGQCNGADISVSLDDAGTAAANDQCDNNPAISGSKTPVQMLSGFNGEDFSGNWTLTITDTFAPDGGTLDSWCLFETVEGGGDRIFANGFEGG
ncbi:MAG: Ig-like domain-containing protein [Pseudomonadota bacterium]